jgi:hypothetical protein
MLAFSSLNQSSLGCIQDFCVLVYKGRLIYTNPYTHLTFPDSTPFPGHIPFEHGCASRGSLCVSGANKSSRSPFRSTCGQLSYGLPRLGLTLPSQMHLYPGQARRAWPRQHSLHRAGDKCLCRIRARRRRVRQALDSGNHEVAPVSCAE